MSARRQVSAAHGIVELIAELKLQLCEVPPALTSDESGAGAAAGAGAAEEEDVDMAPATAATAVGAAAQ